MTTERDKQTIKRLNNDCQRLINERYGYQQALRLVLEEMGVPPVLIAEALACARSCMFNEFKEVLRKAK